MDAHISYAKSADGTTIATWTYGQGSPLVVPTMPGGLWCPSATWDIPAQRRFYDQIAAHHTLVMHDARGMGLSQRDVDDFSLAASTSDLKAVVELHGLDTFAMYGWRGPTRTAVVFAASFPGRVSKLILRDPDLRGQDHRWPPRERALFAMVESDFDFYVEAMALSQGGWDAGPALAQAARGATTKEVALAAWDAIRHEDAWPSLAEITCPTLVIHSKGTADMFPLDVARRVTAAVPAARLAVIEGGNPWHAGDADVLAPVLLGFLAAPEGEKERREKATGAGEGERTSGTAVILFTDIVSSTELTERMGDARFRDASRSLDVALRAAIRDAGGSAIEGKLLGDGVLATFTSAARAIDGARSCLRLSAASELGLHIGVHAGDVIREDNNVFGGAVNIASRICGLSAPGEILVSDVVRGMARSSAGVEFEDRGEQEMKGVGEAVRVYAVATRPT